MRTGNDRNQNPGTKKVELNPMGEEDILMSDIIGQEHSKKEAIKFMKMIENRELVNFYGLTIPNMAFFGPPGTGKTLMAQAMAHQCLDRLEDTLFISLNLQSFATCFINETSNNFDNYMKNIEKEIESDSPFRNFVIFMDEYDSIGRQRGMDMHGEDDKLVNAINSYMDGERRIENVSYIVASNFEDMIDNAQKSRFGIHCKFDLFETAEDKSELFRSHVKRIKRKNKNNLFYKIDYNSIGNKLKGKISGREVRDILNRTMENKLYDMIESSKTIEDDIKITTKDFYNTIEMYLGERKEKRSIGFK